jgi:hypothetical protein
VQVILIPLLLVRKRLEQQQQLQKLTFLEQQQLLHKLTLLLQKIQKLTKKFMYVMEQRQQQIQRRERNQGERMKLLPTGRSLWVARPWIVPVGCSLRATRGSWKLCCLSGDMNLSVCTPM